MSQSVALELLAAFEVETSLYEVLLSILGRERQAIVDGDHYNLAEIIKEENQQVQSIQQAEQVRDEILNRVKEQFNIPDGEWRLDLLKEYVPQPMVNKIDQLTSRLYQLHHQLKQVNDQITQLVSTSLEYTRFCLNAFAEESYGSPSYDRTGKRPRSGGPVLLNQEL